jgi:flagellar L-ring protein precursor FlgH
MAHAPLFAMKTLLSLAAPVLLAVTTAAQGRPGSIYDASHGPLNMIADKTARHPGDLITVMIVENQEVKNEETAQLRRSTTLDYALDNFDIAPGAFNPLPRLAASSQDDFSGTANVEKTGEFTARITAIVMDVLPNGNLVIKGRREIRIDLETKVIEFSGVVRRYDIRANNTVLSELVADARVTYVGDGQLTDTTSRRGLGNIIHRAIIWLWPF